MAEFYDDVLIPESYERLTEAIGEITTNDIEVLLLEGEA